LSVLWERMDCYRMSAVRLFNCPHVQRVAYESWKQFGPSTQTNIMVPASVWVRHVRQIGSNPFKVKTGIIMQIKLAYFGCLVKTYEHPRVFPALQASRHELRQAPDGKSILNDYSKLSRSRSNGDIGVASDRLWYRSVSC
jgi:hypothetical protein